MRRGEIRWADLEPVRGSESDKRRPVVIVSNAANATAERLGRGVVTVVPVTSNGKRVYPFQVLLQPDQSGCSKPPKARAGQVRSIDVRRMGVSVGRLRTAAVSALDDALRVHLDL